MCSIDRALGFFSGEVRDLIVGISPKSFVMAITFVSPHIILRCITR